MKALLLKEYKKLELTDMPEPALGPTDVLVRVKACGICGSDVHGFDGSTGRRIPPIVMGHEAAGVVASVGSAVTAWRAGDRVTFDSTVSCGDCAYCRAGQVNLCDRRRVLGVSCGEYRQHGAFAERVALPQHILYRLPDSLPFEYAALIETLSVAFHAVNRTPVRLGDTAVVVGTGMVGLLAVQAVRLAGAGRVIAVDIDDGKLELARRLGADEALDARRQDLPGEVLRLTAGRGADVALEVVGTTATVQSAIACLRKGGALTLVGNLSPKVELPLQAVVTRELTLLGTCGSAGEYPACIDAMARGRVQVAPLITARAPLEDGPAWFERLHRGEPGVMKVVLEP
ncbi:MAG: galactitol-1-phosphate 5-dehydrogenase [Planctomycetes bacterium]|nr:galactitol-1-phosphate 5-dehydrogenase [Planctomycetota bacterium]